jgi:tripartite-type tricarboxylate transporter receptor subunit TctC
MPHEHAHHSRLCNPQLRRILRRAWLGLLAGSILSFGATATLAQIWPDKPLRIIVPFSAGGAVDVVARILAERMATAMGQSIIIDNRLGAGGVIGTEAVARAAPDGYTLLQGTGSTHGANSIVYKKLPYDPIKDFAPVSMSVRSPFILVVHPSVQARTVAELVAYARANPGKLNYASFGTGSSTHLATELFKALTNTNLVHVPYKGSATAVAGTVAGEAQLMFDVLGTSGGHIRAGKLRVLGVGSAKRYALLPDTPTLAEAGVPGFEASVFFGFFAPAGTPRHIIERLNREVRAAVAAPDVREKLVAMGNDVLGSSPEELAETVVAEVAKWRKLVADRDIKFE